VVLENVEGVSPVDPPDPSQIGEGADAAGVILESGIDQGLLVEVPRKRVTPKNVGESLQTLLDSPQAAGWNDPLLRRLLAVSAPVEDTSRVSIPPPGDSPDETPIPL
jgi:hypothetical protein